jgi:hypothetical protein
MNERLTTQLTTRLPEPAPPASLKATVMARIAREADRREALAARPAPRRRSWRDAPAWLWTTAGIALTAGVRVYQHAQTGAPLGPDAPSPMRMLTLLPADLTMAATILLGLLVYLAGLFAPLRNRERA